MLDVNGGAHSDDGVRPLNARSLVLSVLLGLPTPRLATAALVRLAEVFDVPAGTLRTALSRMVASGELVNRGGEYELQGRLLERKQAQDIARRPPSDAWDGAWWVVAVTVPSRTVADRRDFRTRMMNGRMGELRPDTWLRPANLPGPHVDGGAALVRGALSGVDPSELVGTLWNLGAIEARCRFLLADLERLGDPTHSLPTAIVRAAAVVRFLREEPLLPPALTPTGWPVDELRDRYRDFDRRLGQALRRLVS
jgi:phenylacetic acid degradation operon negative regulatory protein